jgi:hypothetical protein
MHSLKWNDRRGEVVAPATAGNFGSLDSTEDIRLHLEKQPRAVLRLAERYGWPIATAATVARLAGIGGAA